MSASYLSVLILVLPCYLAAVIPGEITKLGSFVQISQTEFNNYINTDEGFAIARSQGERVFKAIYGVPLGPTTAVGYQIVTGNLYKFNATSQLGQAEITVLSQAWLNLTKVTQIRFVDPKANSSLNSLFVQRYQLAYPPSATPLARTMNEPQVTPEQLKLINSFMGNQSVQANQSESIVPKVGLIAQPVNLNPLIKTNTTQNQTNKTDQNISNATVNKILIVNKTVSNSTQPQPVPSGNASSVLDQNHTDNNKTILINKINSSLAVENHNQTNNRTNSSNSSNTTISQPGNSSVAMILKTINSTENHTIRDAGNKIVETLLPQIQLIKDQSALESLGKMIVNSLKAITSTLAQVPDKANIRTVATNSTSGS